MRIVNVLLMVSLSHVLFLVWLGPSGMGFGNVWKIAGPFGIYEHDRYGCLVSSFEGMQLQNSHLLHS